MRVRVWERERGGERVCVFVPSSRFFHHLHQNKTRDRKSVKGIVTLGVEASGTVLTFIFDSVSDVYCLSVVFTYG